MYKITYVRIFYVDYLNTARSNKKKQWLRLKNFYLQAFVYFLCLYRLLDFLNIMTYDLHGAWDPITGHNSPLFGSASDQGEHIYFNIVRKL